MTARDRPDYAALWREQIEPAELAALQAMATGIKRASGRRWLFDRVLALATAGLVGQALWRWPASPAIKLSLALLLLVPIWYLWRRHRIAAASRAIAADDPRGFFEAAIENVRAELNLSTLSAWLGMPTLVAACALVGAARGFDQLYMNVRTMVTLASPMLTVAGAIIVLSLIHLTRDNIRLRRQLRRLEAMHREWEERDPGEEA